jgi:hypothetical protein
MIYKIKKKQLMTLILFNISKPKNRRFQYSRKDGNRRARRQLWVLQNHQRTTTNGFRQRTAGKKKTNGWLERLDFF